MRLTQYTDYSLRLLLYVALLPDGQKATIQEVADAYTISKNHLMKVTHHLGQLGYIETTRGRAGGISLKRAPETINVGTVVRETEDDFHLVECFGPNNTCVISPACRLKHVLNDALQSYLAVLDQYTLADLLTDADEIDLMQRLLHIRDDQ